MPQLESDHPGYTIALNDDRTRRPYKARAKLSRNVAVLPGA
jgi:hypothetical protein